MNEHARLRSLLIVSLLAFCVSCDERPQSEYLSRDAAERAGAFRRGWLPKAMPLMARNIVERHDLDTNAVAARFDGSAVENAALFANADSFDGVALNEATVSLLRDVDWWPEELRAPLKQTQSPAAVYRLREDDRRWRIVQAADNVYAWNCE